MTAQKNSPSDKLYTARALYYTPTTQGLRSFHCDVVVDWKDLLTRANGKEVADDNSFLKYLQTARLSVTDELKGASHFEWANTGVPPEDKEEAAAKMKHGMEQMMNGFFQSWNAYMNGNMVPAPDSTTTVTEVDDGLHLHATSANTVVDERFDPNLLLTEAHVQMPNLDALAYPTYVDTPEGRIVSTIRTLYRTPPTAPPAEILFTITYADVSSYRLPETLNLEMRNVGAFRFSFTGCSVVNADKAAGKL